MDTKEKFDKWLKLYEQRETETDEQREERKRLATELMFERTETEKPTKSERNLKLHKRKRKLKGIRK